jgi:hypothetical protein
MSRNVMLRRPFESTLSTLVGVMDHCGGAPLPQRHVQCFQHQLGAQMSRHRRAHDPTAEGVEHHRVMLPRFQATSWGCSARN